MANKKFSSSKLHSFGLLLVGSILLVLAIGSLPAHGQEYTFEKLEIEEGLSQGFIYSIEEDYRGFLWFGTRDGLNRYDGYEFKTYNHNPTDSNSLSNNEVTVLYEDSAHNLWIGAGALDWYNRQQDRIERIITAEDLQLNQPSLTIQAIEVDRNGDVWIAVSNIGVFRIENISALSSGRFQAYGPYQITNNIENSADNLEFFDIVAVGDQILISHRLGLTVLKPKENGIFGLPEDTHFQTINFDVGDPDLWFRALYYDAQKTLWISSTQGLIKIANPDALEHYQHYPLPEGMLPPNSFGLAKSIDADDEGRLWMTSFNGVLIFDPSDGSYQRISSNPKDLESLSMDNTTDLLIDRSGIVWIGTGGLGINKYDRQQNRFRHLLDKAESERVYSVYNLVEDERGWVWFTESENKLGYLDPQSDVFGIVPELEEKFWNLSDMARDQNGFIWLVDKDKLIKFDPITRDFIAYPYEEDWVSVKFDLPYRIYLNNQGQVWLGNSRRLLRFDVQGERFTSFPLPQLNLEQVNDLYQDKTGILWVGSHQGLVRVDIERESYHVFRSNPTIEDSLNHPRIKAIMADPERPQQFLWLSTGGGGFSRFDKTNHTFTAFTQDDGLPNNFVYGILPDEQGNFWISTNKGLSRFDPTTEKFENFVEADGLQSNEFNSRAYYKNQAGELYFGGINGITKFSPDKILPNNHRPPIVITEMWLMYNSVFPNSENSPLEFSITETKDVFLEHDQNNISFRFAALDFANPYKNQYRYKLEGFDQDWVRAGTERRASYTNLAPGSYTFFVIGSNNDGIWNRQGASLNITVAPPLWKTWWAYTWYLLLASGAVFLIHQYQSDRIRMSEEIKRKAFQNEKLAELDQLKSRFFANISHEFRTPISLIIGKVDELKDALSQKNQTGLGVTLSSIKNNAFQVVSLIDQLLDISRLEDNKLKINRQDGDLVVFFQVLCASLQSSANNKDVALFFETAHSRLVMLADWEVMQKIFQNLIVNAIKFTPSGGSVKVLLEDDEEIPPVNQKAAKRRLKIKISDTGVGIAEVHLPYIFDRFYQSAPPNNQAKSGFGLGLAMVKDLVAIMGGSIDVVSKPGKGTVFTVCLPYDVPDERILDIDKKETINHHLLNSVKAELKVPLSSEPTISSDIGNESTECVLIVEDNEELRHFIKRILSADFQVLEAENGVKGLELAVTQVPDIVITDLMMPEKDGLELSRDIRSDQRTSHIPVIVLTARADIESKLDSLDLGVDDYLVKPFNKQELRKKVRNMINIRQMLRIKYAQMVLPPTNDDETGLSLEEVFLKQINQLIQDNLADEHYGVENLAAELSISTSQLYRKVKALTGLSTIQLIQRYRLEQSKIYLQQGYNVSEVSYKVGFTSPAYFSQLFKKYTGSLPRTYGKENITRT